MTIKIEITLPETVLIRNIDGKPFNVDVAKLATHPQVLADLAMGGMKIIGNNTYNSGGKDAKPAERMAELERRVNGWYAGNYVTVGGPRDSLAGDMKEAFIANRVAKGMTVGDAEKLIRATVTEVFGKDDKATFGRYLDAVATQVAKAKKVEYQTVRDEIEASALAAAEKLRADRAKASAAIVIDADSLFA